MSSSSDSDNREDDPDFMPSPSTSSGRRGRPRGRGRGRGGRARRSRSRSQLDRWRRIRTASPDSSSNSSPERSEEEEEQQQDSDLEPLRDRFEEEFEARWQAMDEHQHRLSPPNSPPPLEQNATPPPPDTPPPATPPPSVLEMYQMAYAMLEQEIERSKMEAKQHHMDSSRRCDRADCDCEMFNTHSNGTCTCEIIPPYLFPPEPTCDPSPPTVNVSTSHSARASTSAENIFTCDSNCTECKRQNCIYNAPCKTPVSAIAYPLPMFSSAVLTMLSDYHYYATPMRATDPSHEAMMTISRIISLRDWPFFSLPSEDMLWLSYHIQDIADTVPTDSTDAAMLFLETCLAIIRRVRIALLSGRMLSYFNSEAAPTPPPSHSIALPRIPRPTRQGNRAVAVCAPLCVNAMPTNRTSYTITQRGVMRIDDVAIIPHPSTSGSHTPPPPPPPAN